MNCPRKNSAARRVALRRPDAFTLLEILVVLAIIGLVAGLAIAKINQIWENAKIQSTELFVRVSLKTPLVVYKTNMGEFPSTADGLAALHTAPSQNADRWHGPYVEEAKSLRDPWGELYQYANPGTRNKTGYDVWSKGPDRQSGTADDIGNWESTPAPGSG